MKETTFARISVYTLSKLERLKNPNTMPKSIDQKALMTHKSHETNTYRI